MPKRLSKRVGGSSRFFSVPMEREIAISCTNDSPLILGKPQFPTSVKCTLPQVTTVGTVLDAPDQGKWSQIGSALNNDSGPSDTHFRITPDLGAIMNQIQPYLALYKECFIAGVTVKIKPTWNRQILNEGLKVTSMMTDTRKEVETVIHDNGTKSSAIEQDYIRPITGTSTCRIPYGQYPQLYYRKLEYAEGTDPHTIMCNQHIAKTKGAKYLQLADGKTQTFRIVPQVYTESMTADGQKIHHPRNAGWFPVDSIMERKFGGMEFCIAQFPNFDGPALDLTDDERSKLQKEGESATWPNLGKSVSNLTANPDALLVQKETGFNVGPKVQGNTRPYFTFNRDPRTMYSKSRRNDGMEYNEHYVIVNRTYHLKFRGRKVYGKHSDWGEYDLKPTDLDAVPQYYDFHTQTAKKQPFTGHSDVLPTREESLKPIQALMKNSTNINPDQVPDITQQGFTDIQMCPVPNDNQSARQGKFAIQEHMDESTPPSTPTFETRPIRTDSANDPYNIIQDNAHMQEGPIDFQGSTPALKRRRGDQQDTNQVLQVLTGNKGNQIEDTPQELDTESEDGQ